MYLEFITFDILGPTMGACTNDSFTQTVMGTMGTAPVYPVLCGMNPGQMGESLKRNSKILKKSVSQGFGWRVRVFS